MNNIENRAIGETTRLVDRYIQDLFTKSSMVNKIYPREKISSKYNINLELLNKIINRLNNEHPMVKYIADKKNLSIYLENEIPII